MVESLSGAIQTSPSLARPALPAASWCWRQWASGLFCRLGFRYTLHPGTIYGKQIGSDFVKLNPNSKIPVLPDQSMSPALSVIESCTILHYLAEKFGALLPKDVVNRTECLSWLFWQESSASFLGGGFGHFYK